jgi:hypothetical protein
VDSKAPTGALGGNKKTEKDFPLRFFYVERLSLIDVNVLHIETKFIHAFANVVDSTMSVFLVKLFAKDRLKDHFPRSHIEHSVMKPLRKLWKMAINE